MEENELFEEEEERLNVKVAEKEDDNYVYDEVKGSHGKKTALSLLNKKVVGGFEMDQLFCDWD
jgi:hypothetical protein